MTDSIPVSKRIKRLSTLDWLLGYLRRRGRVDGSFILFSVAVLVLIALLCYPLWRILKLGFSEKGTGIWTFANYLTIYADSDYYRVVLNSIRLACWTTLISLMVVLPLSWGCSRTNMPFKGAIRSLIGISFVVPSFIGVIAWILLLGPKAGKINVALKFMLGLSQGPFNIFSFTGIVFVLSAHLFPIIFYTTASALDNFDATFENAARVLGASKTKVILTVTLPMVLPAIFNGATVVFLESLIVYGVPAAIGSPVGIYTFATKIYALFEYPMKFEMAAALSTSLLLIAGVLMALQNLCFRKRRFVTVSGKAAQPESIDLGKFRWILSGYGFFVLFIVFVLPVLFLFLASLTSTWGEPLTWQRMTGKNYITLLIASSQVMRSIRNSLTLSFATATIVVGFTFLLAWIVERTTFRSRNLITFLVMSIFLVPSVTFGVGIFLGYAKFPIQIYGTIFILIIAYVTKKIPFGFIFMQSGIKQLDPELEEASQVLGASKGKILRDITWPLSKTHASAAWLLIFAISLRELPMAILLCSQGTETMAVSIIHFLDNGLLEKAAALSILIVLISVSAVSIARRLAGTSVTPNTSA
jgi:iron(III) transport system permease protein